MEQLIGLIDQYGYIALYGLLALGIIGIPVPDEILMTTVGSLTAGEEPLLSYCISLFVSFCGAMTGMMISYLLGKKVGKPFLYKFGKWVKLTPERLNVAEGWFKKYGLWAVAFGYYVPGIRHFTCYLAGVSNVGIWRYLLYAGSGALIWCSTFLTLGHVIGINAPVILDMMHQYMGLSVTIIVLLIAVAAYIYWRIRKRPLL
ncbi:DedA family protein [Paenibacillus allorhizosphaerae]|uniref:VTT domain-containing protein n=1 Tax=Paenibacillus allorhizosphaerae TaxID=2849866 RepID=A0ABM8VN65_9BACL|nr:DedA family protein [Paenibacillus allorhizosphaerae]CAG7650972.1 hypothetical protein PAECIP111802_04852 [Paenibacillus allorhizosphaerae]